MMSLPLYNNVVAIDADVVIQYVFRRSTVLVVKHVKTLNLEKTQGNL